jgi:hypothetical protein
VFPVRYEHHLYIKKESYPSNRTWSPIGVSREVRPSSTYKCKAISVTGDGSLQVFPMRYEHHLHIKSKLIPVTKRGGL